MKVGLVLRVDAVAHLGVGVEGSVLLGVAVTGHVAVGLLDGDAYPIVA